MTVPQPTAPLPNLPLLRKILDHIDAHPEEWNQADFAVNAECGTAFCIAGHAVAMTEGVKRSGDEDFWPYRPSSGRDWVTAASDALGLMPSQFVLGSDEARRLFSGGNSREDVQRAAEAIAARAGEEL